MVIFLMLGFPNLLNMKTVKLLFITLAIALTSCEFDIYSNSIRIQNDSSYIITDCVIDGEEFGNVSPGETTSYKDVAGGTTYLSGGLDGTITLPEDDELTSDRNWTLTVNSNLSLSLTED